MFSIFKQKKENLYGEDYFPFSTDIHSHILPGIDDGSPNVATSLQLIAGLQKLGVTQSIATPHIIGDMYRNNATSINNALQLLQQSLKENNINFTVNAAAEYMLDDYFFEQLYGENKLLTLKENYILTEFSYASNPANIEKMAFNILTEGYTPVLAHPERYGYFHTDLKMYHRLKDIGFLLQLNLLSLTGYYGKGAQKVSHYLLQNDLISFTGTDMHHTRHLDSLQHPTHKKLFAEAFKGKKMNEEFVF